MIVTPAADPGDGHATRGRSPRRILLDCTQTTSSAQLSGIPRVVRSIARHGVAAAAGHGAVLVPVRYEDDRFVAVGLSTGGDIELPRPPAGRPSAHPLLRRLQKLLVPRKVVRGARRWIRRISGSTPPGESIAFRPDDVLLLADSSWAIRFWPAVDAARAVGMRLGVVQYDFIPHAHPELVRGKLSRVFRRWMRDTLARADFVAAISETVADEARAELRRMGRDPDRSGPLVRSFPLGADVMPSTADETPRRELADFLAASPHGPYLTVGTIDSRKNQDLLPDVFERVWRQVPGARLLVAGPVGWKGGEVVRRWRRHPRYGTHLLHVGDLSDVELLHAYRHARGLLFPSRAEGYGLPIVEALAHGIRVFTSDIPVHREVGGDWCVYFPPTDAAALAEAIIRFERDGVFPARRPTGDFRSPTWAEAAVKVMEIALASPAVGTGGKGANRAAA